MDYEKLYERHKIIFEKEYKTAKEAVSDGFQIRDFMTFGEIIRDILEVLDSLQDDLNLDEKKEFLVFIGWKLYTDTKKPWWMRFIPKWVIKRNLVGMVDKALDYLNKKGIVSKSEIE